jgi:DNA-binding CsgD family transcriptional regulator
MGGEAARRRARDHVVELSGRGLDLVGFWRACNEVLAPVLPCWDSPCWFTLDPASLLVTSHFQEGMERIPDEWLLQEYRDDDVNKLADVARTGTVTTLHAATDGDPTRSARYLDMIAPAGGEQELLVGLRTSTGDPWGVMGVYRERGHAWFDASDLAFVRALAPHLADGARRGLLVGEATDPEGSDAPGLLVLDHGREVVSSTAAVDRWLAALAEDPAGGDGLPAAVYAVAGRALRPRATPASPDHAAQARVRTRDGRWVVLHGAPMRTPDGGAVAVIIERAHPDRLEPLLMAAYGLTAREQEVTTLVLRGRSTTDIAAALVVSPETVQQHLKSVFDKTGVRSRRDLVGQVFHGHYEPRLRDNEARVREGAWVRGGPHLPGSEQMRATTP